MNLKKGPALILFLTSKFRHYLIGVSTLVLILLGTTLLAMVLHSIEIAGSIHLLLFSAILGVGWVLSVFCWAYLRYENNLKKLDSWVTQQKKREYRKLIDKHLKRVYSNKIWASLIVPALAFVLFMNHYFIGKFLLSGWLIFILTFGVWLMAVGMFLFLEHSNFLLRLQKLRFNNRDIRLIFYQFKNLGHFSFYASLSWFIGIGVALPIVFLLLNLQLIIAISSVAFCVALGIIFLAAPQYFIHRCMLITKQSKLKQFEKFRALREKETTMIFYNLLDRIITASEWALEIPQWGIWFTSMIFPIITGTLSIFF